MVKVWIFAAVMVVIAGVLIFGLVYAKAAQKMFTSKKKNKEIDK
jgi:hypothetical protein